MTQKHLTLDATWPDGHTQDGLRYGENWRRIRAALREQKKARPLCTFKIRRVKPEPRWLQNSITYRDYREFDRNVQRMKNHHPLKWQRPQ